MQLAYPFLVAYFLDLLLGDPPNWPHPVRWIGGICIMWERALYQPKVSAGAIFWCSVMGTIFALIMGLLRGLAILTVWATSVVVCYLVYSCLATRCLHRESRQVEDALRHGDLPEARKRLSFIVGRETNHLCPAEIRRATIETIAENLSDGVVAPMFYAILLGVPGMALYKAANTLDSMVGYKNDRYQAFGRITAKLDDVFNYLPARITAFLMVFMAPLLRLDLTEGWRILRRDARNASSPNAGWPEAAMAGTLGVRLGGPSIYFGRLVRKPYIGDDTGHTLDEKDYSRAVRLLYGTSAVMAAITIALLALSGAGVWGLAGLLIQV